MYITCTYYIHQIYILYTWYVQNICTLYKYSYMGTYVFYEGFQNTIGDTCFYKGFPKHTWGSMVCVTKVSKTHLGTNVDMKVSQRPWGGANVCMKVSKHTSSHTCFFMKVSQTFTNTIGAASFMKANLVPCPVDVFNFLWVTHHLNMTHLMMTH